VVCKYLYTRAKKDGSGGGRGWGGGKEKKGFEI